MSASRAAGMRGAACPTVSSASTLGCCARRAGSLPSTPREPWAVEMAGLKCSTARWPGRRRERPVRARNARGRNQPLFFPGSPGHVVREDLRIPRSTSFGLGLAGSWPSVDPDRLGHVGSPLIKKIRLSLRPTTRRITRPGRFSPSRDVVFNASTQHRHHVPVLPDKAAGLSCSRRRAAPPRPPEALTRPHPPRSALALDRGDRCAGYSTAPLRRAHRYLFDAHPAFRPGRP